MCVGENKMKLLIKEGIGHRAFLYMVGLHKYLLNECESVGQSCSLPFRVASRSFHTSQLLEF